MGYNRHFELNIDDLDQIERALFRRKAEVAEKRIAALREDAPVEEHDTEIREIMELLGRLHNQKVFYRPKTGVYVGG
ncbi:MAG: hypothetical protein AAF092_01950 [Pseudomonadota bacterium]